MRTAKVCRFTVILTLIPRDWVGSKTEFEDTICPLFTLLFYLLIFKTTVHYLLDLYVYQFSLCLVT